MKYDHKIHMYKRYSVGAKKWVIYRCMLPNCTHHVLPQMLVGRLSICYRCGEDFTCGEKDLNRAQPHCEPCTNPDLSPKGRKRVKVNTEAVSSILGNLGIK